MIRVLFIARYQQAIWKRKVALMAEHPDLRIRYIDPIPEIDERVALDTQRLQHVYTPMLGRTSDPHRALYRTLAFGMIRFKPHVIYMEEEPDSLSALHITFARQLCAPHAKLVCYTWQNVNRPKKWYVNRILRATLRASNYLLCANGEAIRVARAEGFGGPASVLPSIGVDTQIFKPCAARSATFCVGYVGRLVAQKGVDTLIAAVAHLQQAAGLAARIQLAIVGDGPERAALERQAADVCLSDYVQFAGAVPLARIPDWLCQLDALVLPSRTTPVWKEQFGRVLVEAMACKVPVVGSDSGAIPEVIGGAGLIFPEGDAEALAQRLAQLIDSPALRADLAVRGYARVMQHYTQERIAKQTAQFFRQVMTPVMTQAVAR